jgi:hypothetical protein
VIAIEEIKKKDIIWLKGRIWMLRGIRTVLKREREWEGGRGGRELNI